MRVRPVRQGYSCSRSAEFFHHEHMVKIPHPRTAIFWICSNTQNTQVSKLFPKISQTREIIHSVNFICIRGQLLLSEVKYGLPELLVLLGEAEHLVVGGIEGCVANGGQRGTPLRRAPRLHSAPRKG